MRQTETFYNRVSFAYPLIDYFLGSHKKIVVDEVNESAPHKLLEVGVGSGSHLARYKGARITAIDISEAMLKEARKYCTDNVELVKMDGEDMTFHDATFDAVVMCHVLSVANNPERLLDEAWRVLVPGGKLFVLNHFTPDNTLGYLDRAFQPISRLFHFRSLFQPENLSGLKKFHPIKQISVGRWSYFKLLIFSKP